MQISCFPSEKKEALIIAELSLLTIYLLLASKAASISSV